MHFCQVDFPAENPRCQKSQLSINKHVSYKAMTENFRFQKPNARQAHLFFFDTQAKTKKTKEPVANAQSIQKFTIHLEVV